MYEVLKTRQERHEHKPSSSLLTPALRCLPQQTGPAHLLLRLQLQIGTASATRKQLLEVLILKLECTCL